MFCNVQTAHYYWQTVLKRIVHHECMQYPEVLLPGAPPEMNTAVSTYWTGYMYLYIYITATHIPPEMNTAVSTSYMYMHIYITATHIPPCVFPCHTFCSACSQDSELLVINLSSTETSHLAHFA